MKKVARQHITSNLGVARLHSLVAKMGYIWRPTPNDDYGIDGEIEIVEDETPTARILKIQLKSGPSYFRAEKDHTFVFDANANDIEYWSNANNPVLLILYHPLRDRLYWVHVQKYLQENPNARSTHKIVFDKGHDLLAVDQMPRLREIVFPDLKDPRLAFSPKKRECLYSNLLPLLEMPGTVYSLPTKLRNKSEVRERLQQASKPPFILKEGRLWTFSYLPSIDCSLRLACDRDNVVETPLRSWLRDVNRKDWAVELFNQCLLKKSAVLGLEYDRKHKRFYCRPRDGQEWWFPYQSLSQRSKRRPAYPSLRKDGSFRFWIHHSVRLRFVNFGADWFLQVEPGYVFTEDGQAFLAEEDVGRVATKKKSAERNLTVLRHLMFWQEFLSQGEAIIEIFPGHQKLIVGKPYAQAVPGFGLEGDGREAGPVQPEEDDLDLEALEKELDKEEE